MTPSATTPDVRNEVLKYQIKPFLLFMLKATILFVSNEIIVFSTWKWDFGYFKYCRLNLPVIV